MALTQRRPWHPLQCSCLENPMDGGAWWAAVHGVAKSQIWLSDFTFTFHLHALEKEVAAHSSALAWRIPGTGEPGGLPSMGSHRVGHDWSDLAAAAWSWLPDSLHIPLRITMTRHIQDPRPWKKEMILTMKSAAKERLSVMRWHTPPWGRNAWDLGLASPPCLGLKSLNKPLQKESFFFFFHV